MLNVNVIEREHAFRKERHIVPIDAVHASVRFHAWPREWLWPHLVERALSCETKESLPQPQCFRHQFRCVFVFRLRLLVDDMLLQLANLLKLGPELCLLVRLAVLKLVLKDGY